MLPTLQLNFLLLENPQLKGASMLLEVRFSYISAVLNRDGKGIQGVPPPIHDDAHNKLLLLLGILQTNKFSSR